MRKEPRERSRYNDLLRDRRYGVRILKGRRYFSSPKLSGKPWDSYSHPLDGCGTLSRVKASGACCWRHFLVPRLEIIDLYSCALYTPAFRVQGQLYLSLYIQIIINYNGILGALQENWGKRKIEIMHGLNTLSTLFFPPEIKSKH